MTLRIKVSFLIFSLIQRNTNPLQVRTPLNAVINYLEMALEKQLEDSTKAALTASYSASKSLIFVIDDLLNLTGSTTGSILPLCDAFDIANCLDEALDPLKRLAKEKGINIIARPSKGSRFFARRSSEFAKGCVHLGGQCHRTHHYRSGCCRVGRTVKIVQRIDHAGRRHRFWKRAHRA